MGQRHKWYKEIQAWSEGAEIEWKFISENSEHWEDCSEPRWHPKYEYRIKPQPKEKKYLYVIQLPTNEICLIKEAQIFSGTYIGKIEVQDD